MTCHLIEGCNVQAEFISNHVHGDRDLETFHRIRRYDGIKVGIANTISKDTNAHLCDRVEQPRILGVSTSVAGVMPR